MQYRECFRKQKNNRFGFKYHFHAVPRVFSEQLFFFLNVPSVFSELNNTADFSLSPGSNASRRNENIPGNEYLVPSIFSEQIMYLVLNPWP